MNQFSQSELIPISQIQIDRSARQRREFQTKDLEASISQIGLINPIVVDRSFVLRAGERRLTACTRLGWAEIPARFLESLDPIHHQLVELEENIKRQDLDWKDQVSAIASIHKLYKDLDISWSQEQTANALSLTQGHVSMCLKIFAELDDSRIQQCSGLREAFNILARRSQRAMGEALSEIIGDSFAELPAELAVAPTGLLDPIVPVEHRQVLTTQLVAKPAAKPTEVGGIENTSFFHWLSTYSGPKFNLVHCDFPYGVNLFDGSQGHGGEPTAGYQDTPEIFFGLLEAFCRDLDKFMSLSAHMMFWYSAKHETKMFQMFRELAPSLEIQPYPLVWLKSDNAGISSDPKRNPRHVYETCLLASRSKRHILRVVGDAYSCPTDRTLHASTKPESMLRHFMQMFVDNTSSVFDPTCGSGASLRAAESLGASRVLGLELDPGYAKTAQLALKNARTLREAGR